MERLRHWEGRGLRRESKKVRMKRGKGEGREGEGGGEREGEGVWGKGGVEVRRGEGEEG